MKNDGFSLIDSAVSIFLLSVMLIGITSFTIDFAKNSSKLYESVLLLIEKQNYLVSGYEK